MTAQLHSDYIDQPTALLVPEARPGSGTGEFAPDSASAPRSRSVARSASTHGPASTATVTARFGSVDELLADARSRLDRLYVEDVRTALAAGHRLVDIRPGWQRAAEGEIPGALIVERNHLEWRLHPESSARLGEAIAGQHWIVVCSEGYTSSLAADALNSLGVPATDLVGGFRAWQAAGLPTSYSVTDANRIVD